MTVEKTCPAAAVTVVRLNSANFLHVFLIASPSVLICEGVRP